MAAEHHISYDIVTYWRRKLFPNSWRKYDPTQFDWSKTSKELATEHGISLETVRRWRRRLTPAMRKSPNLNADPTTFDWSKPSRELAAEHDVSLPYVWLHRRRLAPHTIPKRNDTDWSKVDWQQTNKVLCKTHHATYRTVQKHRDIHAPGTPHPEMVRQARRERAEQRRRNSFWARIDWSLSTSVISRQTGQPRQLITYNRNIYAPETVKRRRCLPPNADLSLPPKIVAATYGVGLNTVYRALNRAGKPLERKRRSTGRY